MNTNPRLAVPSCLVPFFTASALVLNLSTFSSGAIVEPPEAFDPPRDLWVKFDTLPYQKMTSSEPLNSLYFLVRNRPVGVRTLNAAQSITGVPSIAIHGSEQPAQTLSLPWEFTYSDGSCSLGQHALGDSVTCLSHDFESEMGNALQIVREEATTLRLKAFLMRGVWSEDSLDAAGKGVRRFSGMPTTWDTVLDFKGTHHPYDTLVVSAPNTTWRFVLDWTLVIGPFYLVNQYVKRMPSGNDSNRVEVQDPPRHLAMNWKGNTYRILGRTISGTSGQPVLSTPLSLMVNEPMSIWATSPNGSTTTLPEVQIHRSGVQETLELPLTMRPWVQTVGGLCSDYQTQWGDTLSCMSARKKGWTVERLSAYEVKLSFEVMRSIYGPIGSSTPSDSILYRANFFQWDTVIQLGKNLISDTLVIKSSESEFRSGLPFSLGLRPAPAKTVFPQSALRGRMVPVLINGRQPKETGLGRRP